MRWAEAVVISGCTTLRLPQKRWNESSGRRSGCGSWATMISASWDIHRRAHTPERSGHRGSGHDWSPFFVTMVKNESGPTILRLSRTSNTPPHTHRRMRLRSHTSGRRARHELAASSMESGASHRSRRAQTTCRRLRKPLQRLARGSVVDLDADPGHRLCYASRCRA